MKMLLLTSLLTLAACTPDAGNTDTPAKTTVEENLPIVNAPAESEETVKETTPTPAGETVPPVTVVNPATGETTVVPTPEEPVKLLGCTDSNASNTDHKLSVTRDEVTGKYQIDFLNPEDRALRVISLYVTDVQDEIPTFTNNFKFSGTAYWMVSLDDPFETFFTLPITYGELKEPGVDVTVRYKGMANGQLLASQTEAKCLKISVLTFEPEEALSFKTSTFLQTYRP